MLKEGDPFRAGVGPRRTASQGCFLASHEPQPPTPPKSPSKGKGTWGGGGPAGGAALRPGGRPSCTSTCCF